MLAKKAALLGHGLALVGHGLTLKGRALTATGAKVAAISGKIKGLTAAAKAKILAALVVPAAALKVPKYAYLVQGPKFANVAWNVAHPLTGYRYGQATIGGLRKKREDDVVTSSTEAAQRPVNDLITIVHSRNAQQCLAKVICELSADPNFHGREGVRFGKTLAALDRANLPRAQQFRSASQTGKRFGKPDMCSQSFADCSTPSAEVIKIGNALVNGRA